MFNRFKTAVLLGAAMLLASPVFASIPRDPFNLQPHRSQTDHPSENRVGGSRVEVIIGTGFSPVKNPETQQVEWMPVVRCASGRLYFISTDPTGIDGGVNLYAYGNLNPLAFVDPYGLCAESWGSKALNFGQSALNGIGSVLSAPDRFLNWATGTDEYERFNVAVSTPFPYDDAAVGVLGMLTKSGAALSALRFANKVEDAVPNQPLYHYTSDAAANSIMKQGLNPGRDGFSYLTTKGNLSGAQAQIELALPANRSLPNALLEIDVSGLNKAGISPALGPRRVQGNLPGLGAGGGTELLFNQQIPSQYIQRVR